MSQSIPPYPVLVAEINENPAKWLSQDISNDEGRGTSGETIFAMIRGMRRIKRVRAWLAVERALHKGGRNCVVTKLQQKEVELQKNGEQTSWDECRSATKQTSIKSPESNDDTDENNVHSAEKKIFAGCDNEVAMTTVKREKVSADCSHPMENY